MTTVLITVRPIQAGVTGELRGGDQRVRACCSGPQTVGRKGLSEAGFEPSGNSRVDSTSHALLADIARENFIEAWPSRAPKMPPRASMMPTALYSLAKSTDRSTSAQLTISRIGRNE